MNDVGKFCYYHPTTMSEITCEDCGKPICKECVNVYCVEQPRKNPCLKILTKSHCVCVDCYNEYIKKCKTMLIILTPVFLIALVLLIVFQKF